MRRFCSSSMVKFSGAALAALWLGGASAHAESSGARVPLAGEAPASAPAPVEVIFTGFARRTDQGVSVFVRMTGEVPVVLEQSGRRLVYHLAGAKLGVKNNANPLPTGGFGPPVSSVALVPSNGAVDVVIDLTSDAGEAAPTHRVVSQSKLATLVVDLPPAKAQ
jgi:AMIN domain-containing protein